MGGVMGGLLGLVGMRWSGAFPESAFPSGWFALVYVWHVMVLPLILVGWALRSGFCGMRLASSALWAWAASKSVSGRRRAESLSSPDRSTPPIMPAPPAIQSDWNRPPQPSDSDSDSALEEMEVGSRRDFLGAALSLAPAGLALGVTESGLRALDEFRVRALPVGVSGLPAALEGFRIALLSDLHVGRFTRGRILEKIVETTNSMAPDLVAFTGDLVNYSLEDLPAGLELLGALRAKHGVFAVEGNHDLFMDAKRFRREVSRVVPLLVNESTLVEVSRGVSLELLGLGWGGDLQNLLKRREPPLGQDPASEALPLEAGSARLPILLAHHPHVFDEAEGVALTLSGHTHGGQLMLSERLGVGPMMFRYWSGLYRRQARALVVSNGVGNWFPVRMRAPAEVVEVVLQRA
jgi:predicted MPP superfamily phosphohydrolase